MTGKDEMIEEPTFASDLGVCDLCEGALVAEDDCMCAPCREQTDRQMDTINDPVERILNHHRVMPYSTDEKHYCMCGVSFTGGLGYWRRHVAELVRDALDLPLVPWTFGPDSLSRERFGADGRIIPDGQEADDGD